MNDKTKEILEHFSEDIPTTLENVKKTGRLLMSKSGIKRKMGKSWLTFDFLLDKVTEIIRMPEGKNRWEDFWGVIIMPVKIKEIVFETGVGESAIKEDLKKLEKMKYIKTISRTPYGKRFYVRVFPEYADVIYKELPGFKELCKKYKYCKEKGFIKEAQEVWDEIQRNLETVSKKETSKEIQPSKLEKKEEKPLPQTEIDSRMKELKKKLGLKE